MILNKLKNFWFKSKVYIGIGFAFLAALFVAFLYGRKDGISDEIKKNVDKEIKDIEQAAKNEIIRNKAENDKVVETITNANDVQKENAALADDAVIDKLRDKWSRD